MYRFESKADGDLLMLAPVGDQILRIIGREPAPRDHRGRRDSRRDRDARAGDRRRRGRAPAGARRRPQDDDESAGGGAVGLGQRAWPLLEMMRRSLAERADIVWGV
jgi:hypothetical protein